MRLTSLLLLFLLVAGCKKDNTPPTLSFKAGAGYVSADFTGAPGSSFTVGVIADKGADDLELMYTEVAYDGANVAHLVSRTYVSADAQDHFEQNVTVTLRNQPGTERWVFNINDEDGRITKKEIRVTVQ